MTTIIGVRFKLGGKMYYFDPQDISVSAGTGVIVETARGLEYGTCVQGNTTVPDQTVVQPLKRMVRVATDADRKTLERNKKRADEAFIVCKRKIEERGLDMNLVTAECTFDMNKMLFYFTADGRVDFRELVRDLAGIFRTRIELRQIGVRDEAKMIGGLGTCGRELCCSSYLDDFHPVSINMAKDQNLSLNPAKISGTCGRLMCCLKDEHEAYAATGRIRLPWPRSAAGARSRPPPSVRQRHRRTSLQRMPPYRRRRRTANIRRKARQRRAVAAAGADADVVSRPARAETPRPNSTANSRLRDAVDSIQPSASTARRTFSTASSLPFEKGGFFYVFPANISAKAASICNNMEKIELFPMIFSNILLTSSFYAEI